MTISETILHHIKASGPCATDSIVAYLDEQCTDPKWIDLGFGGRVRSIKRKVVRDAMADLIGQGKASVYSNEPAVCWW